MLKLILVSKPANKNFQKFDVNFTSLSDITIFGTPCNQNISFRNISAILATLCVDFTKMKCVDLLNLSTTTMIESCCFCVFGKPMMKSRDMISHFHWGIGRGYNKLAVCPCSVLTCCHSMHLDRYSTTSDFKPGQKNCFLRAAIIFWQPG